MTGSFRLFVCGFGACLGYLGVTDPKSLMYAAGQQEDGTVLIFFILAVSFLGLADLTMNAGYRQRLPWLKRHRHFILCSLAFCFLAQLYLGYASIRSDGVLIFYLWPGLCTLGVTVLDARRRKGEACGSLL